MQDKFSTMVYSHREPTELCKNIPAKLREFWPIFADVTDRQAATGLSPVGNGKIQTCRDFFTRLCNQETESLCTCSLLKSLGKNA